MLKNNKMNMNLQPLAEDNSSENNTQADSREGESVTNNVVNNNETEAEKTFTQAELDKILTDRLSREKKKIAAEQKKAYEAQLKVELEESEKLAQMNEAERVKAKAEKEKKAFEEEKARYQEERKAFEQEKIKNETMKMLSERNMPVELANFIISSNADEIMDNVSVFEKCFNNAVEKVVIERLKGSSPKVALKSNSENMTKKELLKKPYSERVKFYEENPETYKKLMSE